MADIDVKALAVELLQELKNVATGGNSDGKSGQNYGEGKEKNPTSLNLGGFVTAINTLGDKLTAFAEQIGINTAALKAVAGTALGYRSSEDTSKAFADAAGNLSKDLAAYVGKLEQLRLQAAAGTNVGIGQGDAVRQRAEFQAAGFKDFDSGLKGVTDAAGNFKGSLAGLGHSADDSTRRFNEFSKELSGKEAIQNLIKKNIIQPTDVPKLAMMAAQGKTNALDTPESRDKLVQEMVREAQMISQMSIAYGINKQALMDNVIATNESADAQIRQGAVADDNARRAMRTAQTISLASGKSLSELVGKLSSGARLSKEDRAMLSVGTMGMGGQLTSAVKDVQRTKDLPVDDAQRIAAERRLAGVEAEIRARLVSTEGQRLAQSMKEGPQRAALEKMITEARPAAEAERKIRETTGVGYAESARIAQQRLGAAQSRGEKPDVSGAATPTANTGAKVSETLAEINFAYGKNAAAVSGILADLNEKLGTTAKGFQAVKAALTTEGLGPGSATETVDQKKARLAPLAKTIEAAGAVPGTMTDDLLKRLGETSTGGKATGPVTLTSPSTTVNATGPVSVVPTSPPPATGEPPNRLTNGRLITPPATVTSPATRGTGTLGETGFPTEMKDVVAKLHKGETVVTPDQLTNLISGASMMSAGGTASSLLSKMTGVKDSSTAGGTASSLLSKMTGVKDSSTAGGIDISKIFDTAKTNISSSTVPQSPVTADIIYTGTLKALKEVGGIPVAGSKPETKKVTNITPASKKTDSIIDKQLAKFNLDATGAPSIKPVPKLPITPAVPTVELPTKKSTTGEVQYQNVVDKGPKTAAELAIINAERAASGQQAAMVAASKERMASGLYAQPKTNTELSSASIKNIFDSVSTSISSVTGGGSTTRKSVQSEDSKAAEKQLETLKSQYDKDRAEIGNKIRETLGTDSTKGDVLKELRNNPEAKLLEDRMKATSAELSSRINAGTSTETTFEPGIQRGNIVEKPATSVPITDAMKGYDPILGEYEKEEGDEEPKEINLSDTDLKTKDLHDQLIQLNSSIRQLVEHSASGVDIAGAQVKATRSLSGNRFA